MSKTKPYENPLVPNKKLREIYETMAEVRVLDEFVARTAAKAKVRLHSTHGEEACRVSTAIGLGEGDFVSDSHNGIVMNLIAGSSASSLLRKLDAIFSGQKERQLGRADVGARQLPWTKDAASRLAIALGAAAAIKAAGRPDLVMAYVDDQALPDADWRHVLRLTAELELPVIFVVLPGKRSRQNLCATAQSCGLPGFPVDAADAVAIYRVAQESIGRARGNGGPVLIECMAHRSVAGKAAQDAPLTQLRSFLLGRKVASKAWLDSTGRTFRKQLETSHNKSRARKGGIQR